MAESLNPNPGFIPESWALYGVGVFLVSLRLIGRIHRLGITKLQIDDYLILFGTAWYTLLCVAFNQMLNGAGSNLMTDEEIAALTPEIIEDRVLGSKWVFVSEHAMLLTIWSMKAAMLVLYARVIDRVHQRKMLYAVIAWVVCAFIGDEIALFTICRPLNQYWAVPVEDPQCSTYQYYQIVNAVFNISTDILILAIGIPPVLKARLSTQQKIVLTTVFGVGFFVIIAAVLRAIYCLVPWLISYVYMNWYFREASVAIYVTTLPGIWVLLRDMFPKIIKFSTRSGRSHPSQSYPTPNHAQHSWRSKNAKQLSSKSSDFDMDTFPMTGKVMVTSTEVELGHDGHQNDLLTGDEASFSSTRQLRTMNEIRRDVTFTVEHIPKGEKF